MKTSIVLAICLALGGCASNYVRVTRLDTEGQWMPFVTAKQGGVLVEIEGKPKGVTITWQDDKTNVKVEK